MTRGGRTWAVALSTTALVVAANASQGAYFSQSWGWVALAFLLPVGIALVLGVVSAPGALRAAFAMLIVLLAAWVVLSATWSLSAPASVREAERMLVYVALALALALLLRRGDAVGVVAGAYVGVALVGSYALATRLFPDRFDAFDEPDLSYRLSQPVGYWNSLGLLVAMGIVLGVAVVAHGRRPAFRVGAALTLPVLAAALYFTFSRGAWAALVLGVAVAVALDARRLRLLFVGALVAPASVLAVVLASRQDALTTEGAPAEEAISQGHRLASALLLLVLLSGLLAAIAALGTRHLLPPRWAVRAGNAALAFAAIVAASWGLQAVGGPVAGVHELKDRFDAPYAVRDPADLKQRLFLLSGTGRSESIALAWRAAGERRVLGHGAGTFEYLWYERRERPTVIRDAHSLYAEMLAEVGAVGLALLALALVVPLLAAILARRVRLVAAGTGAYAAWLAHSALDWDWEMVGVTATAMLVGGAALFACERRQRPVLPGLVRWPLLGAVACLTVLAVISLVGNQALHAGRKAVARGDWVAAAEHARRAEWLLSWSHEPPIVLGDAAAGLGDRAGAIAAYRDAAATDPENWIPWLRLAQVARGAERTAAYRRVRGLNPKEEELPGEPQRR